MTPNRTELAIIDRWQHGFPLVEKPFEVVGRFAALDQDETIGIFRRLRENDVISRVGVPIRQTAPFFFTSSNVSLIVAVLPAVS